jgi:hypothetical protein
VRRRRRRRRRWLLFLQETTQADRKTSSELDDGEMQHSAERTCHRVARHYDLARFFQSDTSDFLNTFNITVRVFIYMCDVYLCLFPQR